MLEAIWITVWIQGLFSGFVTTGRYRRCILTHSYSYWITRWRQWLLLSWKISKGSQDGGTNIATLVTCALAKVCTVPVLLVPYEPVLASSAWVFFFQLFQKRTFEDKWHGYLYERNVLAVIQSTAPKYRSNLKAMTPTNGQALSFLHLPPHSW